MRWLHRAHRWVMCFHHFLFHSLSYIPLSSVVFCSFCLPVCSGGSLWYFVTRARYSWFVVTCKSFVVICCESASQVFPNELLSERRRDGEMIWGGSGKQINLNSKEGSLPCSDVTRQTCFVWSVSQAARLPLSTSQFQFNGLYWHSIWCVAKALLEWLQNKMIKDYWDQKTDWGMEVERLTAVRAVH